MTQSELGGSLFVFVQILLLIIDLLTLDAALLCYEGDFFPCSLLVTSPSLLSCLFLALLSASLVSLFSELLYSPCMSQCNGISSNPQSLLFHPLPLKICTTRPNVKLAHWPRPRLARRIHPLGRRGRGGQSHPAQTQTLKPNPANPGQTILSQSSAHSPLQRVDSPAKAFDEPHSHSPDLLCPIPPSRFSLFHCRNSPSPKMVICVVLRQSGFPWLE